MLIAACAASVVVGLIVSGCSQTANVTAQASPIDEAQMLADLRKLYPEPEFKSVRETVIPGVYEVTIGQNVGYMDKTGRYMIQGQLLDLQQKVNLTEPALRIAKRIDVGNLPVADAFKVVRGDGSRVVYIFADPDCPFCRQLESTMESVDNVTAHIFLFPIAEIHPDAYRKSVGIWCSPDRSEAWLSVVLKDSPVATAECDNPVERNIALAQKLGIGGTPTVILPTGERYEGGLSAEELNNQLK